MAGKQIRRQAAGKHSKQRVCHRSKKQSRFVGWESVGALVDIKNIAPPHFGDTTPIKTAGDLGVASQAFQVRHPVQSPRFVLGICAVAVGVPF